MGENEEKVGNWRFVPTKLGQTIQFASFSYRKWASITWPEPQRAVTVIGSGDLNAPNTKILHFFTEFFLHFRQIPMNETFHQIRSSLNWILFFYLKKKNSKFSSGAKFEFRRIWRRWRHRLAIDEIIFGNLIRFGGNEVKWDGKNRTP